MSYKYSKGPQIIGDLKAADDSDRNTMIDFGEDRIDLQTGGSTRLKISGAVGEITFNEAYTFPISDGTNGQVIQTDGNGNLSFATVSGGGGSPGGPDNSIQINDNGSLTGSANLTYDGSNFFIESALQVIGEQKINDPGYSIGEQANRSFTYARHYNFSLSANTWTNVISWRPYKTGGTTDPTQLHAAVAYRVEITGLQNGVGNGYRSRKGMVSYEGTSAANDYSYDTILGSGAISARISRSGWVATLQINADSASSAGFRGAVFVEIQFPRGGGSDGEGIYWSIT